MSECENTDESFEFLSQAEIDQVRNTKKGMTEKRRYAILLDSTIGYKHTSWLKDAKDWILGKQKQYYEKNVVSGTLLEALSDKEIVVLAQQFDPILNYKALTVDHAIWLHCEPKQIRELTVEEMKYLLAVKTCFDRLDSLPKLDWIGSLTIGMGAHLNIPAVFGHPIRVTVRYVGSLPPNGEGECSGTFFGVELLEYRGRGNCNGWFQDYHLFECSLNCGLFVPMDMLILNPNEAQPVKHQPQRQLPVTNEKPLKENDRVEAFDAKGVSEKGTVRWIGKNKEAFSGGIYIVGIHTDQVIYDAVVRFPHNVSSMCHLIKAAKEHTSLFLPIYSVKKIEDQNGSSGTVGHGHNYVTRFSHENRSYNPQDSVSATLADEAKKHGMSPSMVKEKQKEVLKMAEYKKEEARKEQEKAESEERRFKMQQIKNELQIGEIEGFDDTMLDLKRQEKIMEELERQKKENKQEKFSQISKAGATYPESQQSVSESQSRISDYEHHQQPRGKISHQDPHTQCVYSEDRHSQGRAQQGIGQQGTGQGLDQQGMGRQGMGQGIDQQGVGRQGMGQQGISQQDMNQQGMGWQGMGQQGMNQQGMGQQGIGQQGIYQQGTDHQGMGRQRMDQQGMNQQGMGQQGTGQQGMYQQGMDQQGMGRQGMGQQGMNQQGIDQQVVGQQGISQQGVGQQGIGQGMDQQGMRQQVSQQGMGHQSMGQQGIGQQGTYPQGTPQQSTYQDIHSQHMFQQGVHQHGIPQQGMHSQDVYQQGWPHQDGYPQQMQHSQKMFQQQLAQQGIHSQNLQPQGMNNSNMPQPDPYQRGAPQNYLSQQYNLSPNNGNWHGENPSYAMERQHSTEFHQILRAETNISNNTTKTNRQMEVSHNMPPLELGDAVQSGSNPITYGTIKWIGELSGSYELIAGVEMEEPVAGATDGWHGGYQYFMCERGKGVFLRLAALWRDDRFIDAKGQKEAENPLGKFDLNSSIELKTFLQPSEKVVEHLHTGTGKGIQGHQNSCYLDSTLYGLFAFSGAFDDLFLKQASDEIGKTIKSTLQAIVNTLRHDNVVLYNHIMILRDKLDKLQHLKGLKSDEKDPEEFLNLLFKHVLNVEAFLRIKRSFGTDEEFFVQLFVEAGKHNIPKTQDLLTEMFKEQQITFAKYPLRLLLQIPRYGKQFKTFKGVIPSLELDVTTLCEQYAGNCVICSDQGTEFCADCGTQQQDVKLKENSWYFCKECVTLWHKHKDRKHHKPVSRQPNTDSGDPGRLRLLSVLCIETSHYVCFTRVQGSGTNEWVFFDSMAERPDDVHNVPCVTQCTEQLNEWVYGDKDLTKYNSKELPPLVRRFVEDGYLCIYVDQDGIMYGDDGGTP